MSTAPGQGGPNHEHSASNVRDAIIADRTPCPKSNVCGQRLREHDGFTNGAECLLCGQWLHRPALQDIYLRRMACRL